MSLVSRSLTDFNHSYSLLFSGICSVTWTCLIWMSWNVSLTWFILTHPLRNISVVHQVPPSAGNHGLGMRSVLLIITLQYTLCTFRGKICECCIQSVVFEFYWLWSERSRKIFFLTHTAGSAGVSGYVDCVRFSFCLAIA